jgi:RNA polymerase sigma-70 factor (ECF subfamily)
MRIRPQDLQQALAGERAALSRLVESLIGVIQARAARAAIRWGLSAGRRSIRQDVEDLTQEVFLVLFCDNARVLRSWNQDRGLSLPDFVGLVAYRHAISMLRRRKQSSMAEVPVQEAAGELGALDGLAAAQDPRTDQGNTEQHVASREVLSLLCSRLDDALSPLGRQMFDLLFVDGLSAAQVCEVTGMSRHAVYAWHSRLTKRARSLLDEILVDESPQPTPAHDRVHSPRSAVHKRRTASV